MAWWAVLYTLSMLARYQPAGWAGHINVDGSRHAVAVERLLKRAISLVPALIAEAIDQVAGTSLGRHVRVMPGAGLAVLWRSRLSDGRRAGMSM